MDQYLSTVVVAVITGIFSVVTLIIQKRQDKVINKIDEQTAFMDKEKDIRKRLSTKEKEREQLMHEVMILVLDTNLHILKNTQITGATLPDEAVFEQSEQLKDRFIKLTETIQELNKEYELVLDMTSQFRQELNRRLQEESK